MAIINGKETAFGPLLEFLFTRWFRHIQNNRHAILVVISLDPLVRVRRITGDQAVRLRSEFSLFKILKRIRRLFNFPFEIRATGAVH